MHKSHKTDRETIVVAFRFQAKKIKGLISVLRNLKEVQY